MEMTVRVTGWIVGVVTYVFVSNFVFLTIASATETQPSQFGFDAVIARAQELAQKPYEQSAEAIPPALRDLSFDDFGKIRFRPDQALWRNQRLFEVQLFHLGFVYRTPVRINIVENDQVMRLPFRREMFDYSNGAVPEDLPDDLGFAGFRLHYPLHTPDRKDEIAVFLGASYFRILGREQRFGSFARGLAVDTALSSGEEFPVFREFWLVAPDQHDPRMTVYGLLDSRRVTGAFEFRIEPGTETVVEVEARIFCRDFIEKLGLAPLTSMFFFGENSPRRFDDYRPEVHNSDGLLMHTGKGEWIWRPLANPADLRVSAFIDSDPRGFGLMQRDRNFASYLDLDGYFERRPSIWVEPIGAWGQGSIELVEIPIPDETNDNIVAFWVPNRTINAGETLSYRYRLHAELNDPYRPPLGRAMRTRTGTAEIAGNDDRYAPETRLFVVDFKGGELKYLAPSQPIEAVVIHSSGRVFDKLVTHNKNTEGWRVAFRFDPEGGNAIDLKVFLKFRGEPVTESWTYLWTPSLAGR